MGEELLPQSPPTGPDLEIDRFDARAIAQTTVSGHDDLVACLQAGQNFDDLSIFVSDHNLLPIRDTIAHDEHGPFVIFPDNS